MSLSSISKVSLKGSTFFPTCPKKFQKNLLDHPKFFSFEKKGKAFLSTHFDVISLPKSSSETKENFHFRSLIHRLRHPKKEPFTFEELENLLDQITAGDFEKKASSEELSTILHLLIDYAKKGTEDSLDQKKLEKEIRNLFEEENKFSPASPLVDFRYNNWQVDLCFKKKGNFNDTCKKVGNFFKKHKKAIIIGLCVAAGVAVATVVTIAIVNTVGAAAAAEAVATSGAAAAAALGAPQFSEETEIAQIESSQDEEQLSDTQIPVESIQSHADLNQLPYDPFEDTIAENIALFQLDSDLEKDRHETFMPIDPSLNTDAIQVKNSSIFSDTLAFSKACGQGLIQGGKESIYGLGQLGKEFMLYPLETADKIYTAFTGLGQLALCEQWGELCEALSPEAYQLATEWNSLSLEQRGELAGYTVGKLGTDILVPGVAGKALAKGIKGAEALVEISNIAQKIETPLIMESVAPIESGVRAAEMMNANRSMVTVAGESIVPRALFGEGNLAIEKLSEAGQAIDRQGLTKAGRGLAKHGGRDSIVFPKPTGNPAQINFQGQQVLEKILNHPEKEVFLDSLPRYGDNVVILSPEGGVRFDIDGNFIGFLEPN